MTDTILAPPDSTGPKRVDFRARLYDDRLDELRDAAEDLDTSVNSLLNEAVAYWLQRRQADRARLDRPDGPPVFELISSTRDLTDHFELAVNGVTVPFIRAHPITGEHRPPDARPDDELYTLVCDAPGAGAFGTETLTRGELWKQAWFWAQAMAIAAGYTSHGENSRLRNPHGPSLDVADGWQVMAKSGASGHGYGIDVRFSLPSVDRGDQWAHELVDDLIAFVTDRGAREVYTQLSSYAGIEQDRRGRIPVINRDALTE